MNNLVSELRSINSVRRDSTPLSTVIDLMQRAADEIEGYRTFPLDFVHPKDRPEQNSKYVEGYGYVDAKAFAAIVNMIQRKLNEQK